ncbi:MAG: 16S rRNA (cytosine(1402)-N(4))-methyltransferase RsmH [Clostridiales Family XIII bacterium]|jgi:16S rRNA (cytosine1402-N4)-methyltransferase|nr:16S rRNA (cytosine(1402)-N(4))-methyltransferase RsmH [Clostridiales Family XIII bacterium]
MDFVHAPVLLKETIEGLSLKPGQACADGTLGGGGHAEEICKAIGEDGLLIGVDLDEEAIAAAKRKLEKYGCHKIFENTNYRDIPKVMKESGIRGLNAALLDLGVSSKQLDDPGRGFSYMNDGPLDMRMDGGVNDGLTAKDVVNGYSEEELARIIALYGEERWAKRIAKFIASEREKKTIGTTGELTEVIKKAIPAAARRDGPHPAKRTFQAIRIEVNGELGSLTEALDAVIDVLFPLGRLAVITFHSLEDRIVKEAFRKREDPCECPKSIPQCVCGKVPDARRVTRKPIIPAPDEVEANPRARSAKLRIIEKL